MLMTSLYANGLGARGHDLKAAGFAVRRRDSLGGGG